MPFTSYRFVIFVACVLGAYNLAPSRFRSALLLVASYFFYADSNLLNLLPLLFITAAAYAGARAVATYRHRALFAIIVGVTFLPLLSVKYYAFFAQLLQRAHVIGPVSVTDSVLPIGLSFYTFHAVSYVSDVYRGTTTCENNFGRVAVYLAFFPKLLAGPIERAGAFIPQVRSLTRTELRHAYVGMKYVMWGFFCKLVVADNIAAIVDRILSAPQQESGGSLSLSFMLYSFQIYFDFLGYTSIAIGVARCFNIELNRNFNTPYRATSLRDFWRRWHISLSSWFRDYVYIPLGGSATRGPRRAGQVLTVFLLSGLWHGAALNFVAWGGFHGVAYLAEEQARKRLGRAAVRTPGGVSFLHHCGCVAITFIVVTVAWVFFRLSDYSDIRVVIQRMFLLQTDVPYTYLNPILGRTDSLYFIGILCTAIALDSWRRVRASIERIPDTLGQIGAELLFVNWLVVTLVLLGDRAVSTSLRQPDSEFTVATPST